MNRTRVKRKGVLSYAYTLAFDPAGQVVDYIPKRPTAQDVFGTEA